MPSTQAVLTPATDQTPAVVKVGDELSGGQWVGRFPGSASLDALVEPFRTSVIRFKSALESAGAIVRISATFRPKERAYLMHWSWKIVHGTNPNSVPPMDGVNIEWVHSSRDECIEAAQEMVDGYEIQNLGIPPALATRHTQRKAVDMRITWHGNLAITNASGQTITITSIPRTSMNTQLHAVGASYGVIKFLGGNSDKPHWSTDGH